MAIENSMEEESITQRHHNGLLTASRAATAAFSHSAVAAKNGGGEFLPLSDDSGEDEELTSLTWLQDTNLLKNIQMYGAEDVSLSSAEFNEQGSLTNGTAGAMTPNATSEENKESAGSVNSSSVCVQYNPRVHINAKPPYSFSCLIFMAIENSPGKALPVKDIYSWILTHFPYFQHAPIGWKNSVRHNLSLNKCFRKVDKKGQNIGKGSLWCIDPEFRPTLIQNLKRAPDLPLDSHLHQLTAAIATTEVTPSTPNGNSASATDSQPASPASSNVNLPSPDLFPFLSRRLAASNVKEFEVKSDPDVDAAATMLALKNGREYSDEDPPKNPLRVEKKHRAKLRASFPGYQPYQSRVGGTGHHQGTASSPVITTSPSEDHTYSASLCHRMTDDTTSSEEEDEDEEEHKKLAEGAQLLLELAQISRFPSSQSRFPADIKVDSA